MANWQHKVMTNDELKELVRGVYDMKYFVSLQCEDHMIMSVFMPIMFLGAEPSRPSFPKPVGDIRKDRKRKLNHLTDLEQWEKDLQEWKDETPIRDEFLKNIGMLYEEYSKAGPRGINGMPIFFSCKIVSIEDTKRFREMYTAYCDMREKFEKEWGVEKV